MADKVALVADPGIDGAFAVALALHDPALDVLALGATAGNVPAEQATKNVHILIEQMDPPRWPKLGAALPVEYEIDGTALHGPNGLGGVPFPCSQLHNILSSDKVLIEQVRLFPGEVTVACLGPLTTIAAAIDRDPEFPRLVKRLICLGGTIHEPGNVGPVTEFHFACDPLSARQVLRSGARITMIPLDAMRQVLFSPRDLLDLPAPESPTCRFLKEISPFGIGAASNLYGVEGFYLKDVLGIVPVAVPATVTTQPMEVDVEPQGELTRGMAVIDRRAGRTIHPNVDMVVKIDGPSVRNYVFQILRRTGGEKNG
jgi:inosine-uridine nucleoside N-ribohydrolase